MALFLHSPVNKQTLYQQVFTLFFSETGWVLLAIDQLATYVTI